MERLGRIVRPLRRYSQEGIEILSTRLLLGAVINDVIVYFSCNGFVNQKFLSTFVDVIGKENKKMKQTTILLSVAATFMLATTANAASQRASKTSAKQVAAQREAGLHSITEDAARAHVYFLADDLLEGRRAGERGSRIAKQYIISRMRELGLRPFLGDSYEQPFEACGVQRLKRSPSFFVEADSVANIKKQVHQTLHLSNVLAVLPGKKTDECVVVGAHLDHEGVYPDNDGDKIYNGADDNASGVSAVLQIMKAFAVSGAQPERTIVFAFWDGEEHGLLGSRYFTLNYPHMDSVKGYLNFDMVGSGTDSRYLMYFFTASHPKFGEWLKADMKEYSFSTFEPDYRSWDNPIGGSDQSSFHLKGVPIVWYHTGGQPHYNQPSDEPQTINYPKLTDITRASYLTTWHLANEQDY